MQVSKSDLILCWICDYILFAAIFLIILLLGLWRLQIGNTQGFPVSGPIATSTLVAVSGTTTPQPTSTQIVSSPISPTATSAPEKPEFVIVFVPVNWQSSQSAFETVAQSQADTFISESNLGLYFTPKVIILQDGLQNVSLSNENLIYDILEFGLQKQAGDRYIGLTDGDLKLEGNSDIVGWTSGGQAVVAESNDPYVVAHELGHTFDLCDEYSFTEWSLQNSEKEGGCPNPYPPECPRVESDKPNCVGLPTQDGRNSIMGPAGLDGQYGFNLPCITQLENYFKFLSEAVAR